MFDTLPIAINAAIFAAAAGTVWLGGVRLARHADEIAERTGLTRAFVGLLLLASATSLPEIATTVTASAMGNARLAVNNLTGGVALQTAVLAIVDLIAVRGALTFFTPKPALLLQGTLLMLLLGVVLCGTAAGEPIAIGWIGAWPLAVVALLVVGVYQSWRYERAPAWRPLREPERGAERENGRRVRGGLGRASAGFALASLLVLAAGWAVASVGDVLAEQTGLGGSFIGATLVAGSTSLPELSTSLAAVRRGAYAMAVSNIFGGNMFDLSLLALADIIYTDGPILSAVDRSAAFAAALGLVLTAIYVWGLVERRDRTVLRMGIDSAAVFVVYALGVVVLYSLRGGTG